MRRRRSDAGAAQTPGAYCPDGTDPAGQGAGVPEAGSEVAVLLPRGRRQRDGFPGRSVAVGIPPGEREIAHLIKEEIA